MKFKKLLGAAAAVLLLLTGCAETVTVSQPPYIDLEVLPVWDGAPYLIIDDNVPGFTDADVTTDAFERYSALDTLGRCGSAYACVSQALLSDEDRGSLGSITPTGWVNREYDFIDGKYLYNRIRYAQSPVETDDFVTNWNTVTIPMNISPTGN